MKTYIFFALLFVVISTFVYAGGKVEETRFTDETQRYYLSPAVEDGKFDSVILDLSPVSSPKGRSFIQMTFTVYDADGTVAYTEVVELENTKVLPRITYGGKDLQGATLPDGSYFFTITSKDDKNNESVSKPFSLVIDNTAPEIRTVRIITGNTVVPDGEHNVKISIEGSAEVLWQAFVTDEAGTRVPVFSRKSDTPQAPPKLWSWKGRDTNGTMLEDGLYMLTIFAHDEAGNSAEFSLNTGVIVSSAGALTLSAEHALISPNKDGIMDVLPLTIRGDEQLLNSFISSELVVSATTEDDTDIEKRTVIKAQSIAQTFDGKDEHGILLEDGTYNIAVHLITEENNVYVTNSIAVTIDTNAPNISFSIETNPIPTPAGNLLYFGGENHITGSIAVKDKEATISIDVMHNGEKFFTSTSEAVNSPIEFSIGQESMLGEKVMEDGLYEIMVTSRDLAGNIAQLSPVKVIRDTEEKTMTFTSSASTVSGRKDPLHISALYSQVGLKKSSLIIKNAQDAVVRSENFSYHLPSYYWNARDNQNNLVTDGMYSVEFTAMYYNGDSTTERILDIVVDSTPPTLETFEQNTEIVSPKGEDDAMKSLMITQESSEENNTWRAEVRNIFDTVITEQTFDSLSTFTWDAKNSSGEIVPDGDYFYILVGKDAAGNRTEKTTSFIVDTSIYESGKVLSIHGQMPEIYFPGYSDDIFALTGDKEKILYENLLAARSIAKLLKTYKDYLITITGHAARLLSGEHAIKEQNEVLLPLSRKRAETIRRALVILGIDENRITMRAVGGTNPAVEKPTTENIWRNRRVNFEINE